jgi:hypothetical protein
MALRASIYRESRGDTHETNITGRIRARAAAFHSSCPAVDDYAGCSATR